MSWWFWMALGYAAGLFSASTVFALFHAGRDQRAEDEVEAHELAAMYAIRRLRERVDNKSD